LERAYETPPSSLEQYQAGDVDFASVMAGHYPSALLATNKKTVDSFEIANELPRANILRFIMNT